VWRFEDPVEVPEGLVADAAVHRVVELQREQRS
jgi:hypothetical protein